jgi:hypothetical protein
VPARFAARISGLAFGLARSRRGRRGPPGGRRFSVTVKMDLKIAAVITVIG